MRVGPWAIWDPRKNLDPTAHFPRAWTPGNPAAVLVDVDAFASPAIPHPILCLGHTFVTPTRHPATMARSLARGCPSTAIPALLVERQEDLGDETLAAFGAVPGERRAVVVRPRGGVNLAAVLALRPVLDVVVVLGSWGLEAWPLAVDHVRALRDQAAGAGVPFAFLGWGRFGPQRFARGQVASHEVVLDTGHLLDGRLKAKK